MKNLHMVEKEHRRRRWPHSKYLSYPWVKWPPFSRGEDALLDVGTEAEDSHFGSCYRAERRRVQRHQ